MEKENTENQVVLFISSVELEIAQICAILEENNIPFIRVDDGSGAYMNVIMGQSIQEKKILVNESDYEKASKLIEGLFTSNESESVVEDAEYYNQMEDSEEDNEKDVDDKYYIVKKALIAVLCIPVVIVLFVIIIGIIMGM